MHILLRRCALLFLLVGIFGISGCAVYPPQPPPLGIGSTVQQVRYVLGPPTGVSARGSTTTWKYPGDTRFVFRDGIVESYDNYPSPKLVAYGTPNYGYVGPAYQAYYARPVYAVPVYSRPYYGGWGGGWGRGYGWGGGGGYYNRGWGYGGGNGCGYWR